MDAFPQAPLLCSLIVLCLAWIGYRGERDCHKADIRAAYTNRPNDSQALLSALAAAANRLSVQAERLEKVAHCAVRLAAQPKTKPGPPPGAPAQSQRREGKTTQKRR